MRLLAVALAVACLGRLDADVSHYVPSGLGDSVPELFLKLVNNAIKGSIRSSTVHYVAPSTVTLDNAALYDPDGAEVARVKHAEATLSLSSLLAGDLVVSRIDVRDPRLALVLDGGKLNLLEALLPKKPITQKKPNETAFRIDTIVAHGGGFTFTDKKNVSLQAEDIDGSASLDVDLKQQLVVLDVREPRVASGIVKLAQLDVPMQSIGAQGVRVLTDRVELVGVYGIAASGAKFTGGGTVVLKDAGSLLLKGTVDAAKNVWPDRLHRLPFDTPPVHASVDVTGPFADPHVAVDGSFAHAEAYGYDVDAGRGVVEVTKDLVRIKDGSYVKGGGTIAAIGTVQLPSLDMELKLRAIDVPLSRALEPAQLDPAPKGVVNGRATITGIADGEKPIVVDANVTAHGAVISAVKVRGDVDGSARVTVRPKAAKVTIENATIKGDRIDAKGSGDVFTDEQRIAFQVDANVDDPTTMVAAVPEEVRAEHATFTGTIAGPYKNVHVDGNATADKGGAYGVPIAKVRGHVNASADDVTIDSAHALAADGVVDVTQAIHVALKGKHALTGVAVVKGADLAKITTTTGDKLPIAGTLDAEATLTGPYDDPTVKLRAAAGALVVSGEQLGQATARGSVTRKLLVVDDAAIKGGIADAHTEEVRLQIPDLVVDGHVHIEALDLARIDAAKSAKLAGTARGIAIVHGDVKAPDVDAKLVVENMSAGGQKYGDGNVDVLVAPEKLAPTSTTKKNAPPPIGHVVSIAARVGSNTGTFAVRASYAVERRVVNANAKLERVDLAPFSAQLGSSIAPLQGFASGIIDAQGPLDALNMHLRLHSPELTVARADKGATAAASADAASAGLTAPAAAASAAATTSRVLGAIDIDARMQAGSLNAEVCAFDESATEAKHVHTEKLEAGSPCATDSRVWATVVGDVNAAKGTFDLALDGFVDEHDLEDLFPALAARGLDVNATARASAQLVREEDKPVDVRAQATLLSASVQPPGSLRADLVDPAEVSWADERVQLSKDGARFRSPAGDVDVTVKGSVGTKDIALDVNGALALGVAKAFTQQIGNAQGTATTQLAVRGTYAAGLTINGTLTPAAGAVITPRALGAPITFLGGSISFAPAPAPSKGNEIRVTAHDLHARLRDGDVVLKGDADVRTSRTNDQGLVARWDLSMSGTGVELRYGTARAEGAVDISLKGDEAEPTLKGRVEVTDGLYRRTLELRNFILEAPPEKESEPLWQTLAPVGLENLQLDVALSLQNFRTRVNVATFDADVHVRGNLQLKNTLRLPQLDGAVEVEDGTIDFPRARFDVEEMQVEFAKNAADARNPHVSLAAHTELPAGTAGNDTEIPVDLSLDGDLQKGLNLDLTAIDPQHAWTRSELLGVVLFGRTLTNTVAGGVDTNVAVRALMSEATAPLTQQIEQFTSRNLGLDVEIDPGGWRWQIGRRLQLEGPGILLNQQQQPTGAVATTGGTPYTSGAYTPGAATSSGAASLAAAASASPSTAEDAVRLRFLILDPFFVGPVQVGKNLSLVGSTSSLGQELRLSLRFFEE